MSAPSQVRSWKARRGRWAVVALVAVTAASAPAMASAFGTHAIVGGLLGVAWSESPVVAFLIGFVSHALLDMMPHHDPDPTDGADIALFSAYTFATIFATAELGRRTEGDPRFVWGAIGGALPDLEHVLFYRACGGFDLCEAKLYPTHDGTLPHLGSAPVLVGYPLEIGVCLLAIRIAF
ncbi:MAG: hypothetical protein JSW65_02510 [Candidatus Bipolaricaulota bacterium]|nr:MAG: hypothetical protein JSW65_02510 [Candidatus Bipolaricaulota bacterium]